MAKRVSKADLKYTELQKIILSMSGKYSAYEIFTDWIKSLALSISNSLWATHGELWREREDEYLSIMKKYTPEEQQQLARLLSWLVKELEENPRDVLGEAFMRSGMGTDAGGQFFTPFNISKLLAATSVDPPDENRIVRLNEPSCGSGGSIIASALHLQSQGFNYQKCMRVVAQDLDWRCVYMCYVQLSLMGINAICVQGDTLMEPYLKGYPEYRILRTPAAMGVLV